MRLAAALLAPLLLAAAGPADSPSFACTGPLNPSEAAICADPELAAWDRAVALLYPIQIKQGAVTPAEQREWLELRDRCADDRVCLRATYQSWRGFPAPSGYGSRFDRRSGRDIASLEVAPLGGDWYAFSVTAIHIVQDRKGRPLTANDGGADGVFRLVAGKGQFDSQPGEEMACRVEFEKQPSGWWLEDNGQCGGLNVTLNGEYLRSGGRKRK